MEAKRTIFMETYSKTGIYREAVSLNYNLYLKETISLSRETGIYCNSSKNTQIYSLFNFFSLSKSKPNRIKQKKRICEHKISLIYRTMLTEEHTIIFTFFQGFLRFVQAPRVYPGGRLCVVAIHKYKEKIIFTCRLLDEG